MLLQANMWPSLAFKYFALKIIIIYYINLEFNIIKENNLFMLYFFV